VFGQSTVVVAIKEELIRCVASDVAEFLSVNVISQKRLRTLVGRAAHVALLIFTRPCQGKLSACTTIDHYQQGTLERKLDVWSRLTTSNKVQIVVDASLWGIDGI